MLGMRNVSLIGLFWFMQILATLCFKLAGSCPSRWLWGFVAGNVLGVSSSAILIFLYRVMNPNVALGLGVGGGFLACQVALAVILRTGLSWGQYLGILGITTGMALLALGKRG